MLRTSVVFFCKLSMTNRICSLSSFKNRERTTSWGKSLPAIRVVFRLAQTVSTISNHYTAQVNHDMHAGGW